MKALITDCKNLNEFAESYYKDKKLIYIGSDCPDYKFLKGYDFFDFDDAYMDFPPGFDKVIVTAEGGQAYAMCKKLFTLQECLILYLREQTLNKIL